MPIELNSLDEVDQGVAVGPQIHQILRDRIVKNDIVAGSKISESEIAKTYSISRQPVREAFIRLSEEGLVSIRPQRYTIVRKIEYTAVLNARFVREAIEADIVKLLAANSNPSIVKELRSQLDKQRQVETGNPLLFVPLDELFHRTLAEAVDKVSAWNIIVGMKPQLDRVRFLSCRQFPISNLVDQHNDIVDYIEIGEIDKAETSIRTHLKEILRDLPEIHAANPDMFDRAENTGIPTTL